MSYFTDINRTGFIFVESTTDRRLKIDDLVSTIIRFVSETYREPRRRAGETRSGGRKGDDTRGRTRERSRDLSARV